MVCADKGIALHTVVHCRVLPSLNHDVVLGIDWLRASNPVIDCRGDANSGPHGVTAVGTKIRPHGS